jgi:glycerate 2-kinase
MTSEDGTFLQKQRIQANQAKISLILAKALMSADPYQLVNHHILLSNTKVCIGKNDDFNNSRLILIALGKASLAMTRAVMDQLGDQIAKGVCVCKSLPTPVPDWKNIQILQGSHPIPDVRSVQAGEAICSCLQGLNADDQVLVMISGGASALVSTPVEGISLDDLKAVNQQLLGCGATINEMNAVRKHLEVLKGGGLARLAAPAQISSLILSDVIGDDMSVIASGPTVADPSTYPEVLAILDKYQLGERIPAGVMTHLKLGVEGKAAETLKPGDELLKNVNSQIIGSNELSIDTAIKEAERLGFKTVCLSRQMVGEASEMGRWFVQESQKISAAVEPPLMVVAGGETTVTIHGAGKGGRNQELALAGVKWMADDQKAVFVTLATDGEDGPTDAAGGIVTYQTMQRAQKLGLDPEVYLNNNDAYSFFEKVEGLVKIGATGTNVNDLTFYFKFA